jgi:predicted nucleic acid-binding protein
MTRQSWLQRIEGLSRVAFDTNALIYLFERRQPYLDLMDPIFRRMIAGHISCWISMVVEMEMLVGPMRERNSSRVRELEVFLEGTPNLASRAVDRAIARRAAQLRADARLAPMDSLIAATAIEERCDAIIGNDSRMASRLSGIRYLYLHDYVI